MWAGCNVGIKDKRGQTGREIHIHVKPETIARNLFAPGGERTFVAAVRRTRGLSPGFALAEKRSAAAQRVAAAGAQSRFGENLGAGRISVDALCP